MSAVDELGQARAELEALLVDVLAAVSGDEAAPAGGLELPPGPVACARLAIHDEVDGTYTEVSIRTGVALARVLAGHMLFTADPGPDDVLDAVGELGNIAGGNVQSLLRGSCRLSLPTVQLAQRPAGGAAAEGVTVRSAVLGHVVELSIRPADTLDGLLWPGTAPDEALETLA